MRVTIVLFFSILFFQLQSQSNLFSFKDTTFSVGMLLNIEAVDYTNDINKYGFNKNKIDSLVYFLKKNYILSIEIICNSDFSKLPLLAMMATSEQAQGIRKYMVKKGVEGSRIEIYGNGDMNLLVSESDKIYMDDFDKAIADKTNRRIEIIIIKIKKQEIKKPSKGVKSYLN